MKRILNNLRQPRTAALIRLIFAAAILLAVMIAGMACREQALATDFTRKNLAPCAEYLFGTDWMGRDMLTRTQHPHRCGYRCGERSGGAGGGRERRIAGPLGRQRPHLAD